MKNINKNLIFVLIIVAIFGFSAKNTEAQYMNINTSYTSQGTTRATLSGTINPGGNTTTAWFQYASNSNFSNYKETPHKFIGSQNGEQTISEIVTNLASNTTYYARVVADNGRNIIRGNVITFTTTPDITNNNTVVNRPIVTNTQTVARNQIMYVEAPAQRQKVVYVEIPANQVYAYGYNQVYQPYNYTYATNNTNASIATSNTNTSIVTDYNVDYDSHNSTLNANAFLINDFLPNNLFGLLILILVIASIVAVIRRLVI